MKKNLITSSLPLLFAGQLMATEEPVSTAPRFNFTGDDTRIGVGYHSDSGFSGEVFKVFGEEEQRLWIFEGWGGEGGAGLKLSYHWHADSDTPEWVHKLFLAADQNDEQDRKVALGYGLENQDYFLGFYGAAGITDERRIHRSSSSASERVFGEDNSGAPFYQDIVTTTITDTFEQAYDYGIGLRGGKFFPETQLRLRGGLDWEWGDYDADQLSVTVGLEKYFENTPHSIALNATYFDKSGEFDQDDSDTFVEFVWRYEFGKRYQPATEVRRTQVTREVPVQATQPAPQMVLTEANLRENSQFALDSAQLSAAASRDLAGVLERMRGQGRLLKVRLVGHTCDLGPDGYNLALSQRRADSVAAELQRLGVPREDLIISAAGEADPLYPNTSAANRALNRRVELQFVVEQQQVQIAAAPQLETVTDWHEEVIVTPPDWLRQAMRNPVAHKRRVDTYRFERTRQNVEEGEPVYINRGPVAQDDQVSLDQDSQVIIAVLDNDSDPDGDPLAIAAVTQPEHGQVVINGDQLVYTPDSGYSGSDSFSYSIHDGRGGQASAQVQVEVHPANGAPEAQDDQASTQPGTAVTIAVLENDSDPDGDPLAIASVGQPGHGQAIIQGDQVVYTPAPGFTGTDSFSYSVEDGRGGQDSAEVRVEVAAANAAPLAQDDQATTQQDTPVSIPVLDNDSDPEGDPLTITQVTPASHGQVSLAGDQVIYTPNPGFSGSDSFGYSISDGQGNQASAEVQVEVLASAGNTAPVAVDDQASTNAGQPVSVLVLTNDSDADQDPLTIVSLTQPGAGTASIQGDAILYTPPADFVGQVEFSYTISDGRGGTATATVSVQVLPANQPPLAIDDRFSVPCGIRTLLPVLDNDSDPEGDSLTIVSVTSPQHGGLELASDGQLYYTSDDTYNGPDSFEYTITDGQGNFATAVVSITVLID